MNKKIVERKPHYGLRKFSIGVVSVLIGTSMYFGVSSANAMAAEDSPNNAQVATETKKSVEEEKDTAKEDKAANQTEKDTTKESNKETTKQADPAKKTETSGEKPFIDDSE